MDARIRMTLWFLIPFLFSSGCVSYPPRDGGVVANTFDIPFVSHDGYEMRGKLTIPASPPPYPLVIYVQAAEGMTVDMKRPDGSGGTFNYFDLYASKLPEMNVAFFRYDGRGIGMGDEPPRYEKIDWDVYNTSTLENKVRDIMTAVRAIGERPDIDPSRIFLMGVSEGTLLAAEAATRLPGEVKGLILYGLMSANMRDMLRYMLVDGRFLTRRYFFDTDRDCRISKREFEADWLKRREILFKDAGFDEIDCDGDGYYTIDDVRTLSKGYLDAIDTDNYEVLDRLLKTDGAASIPKDWLRDHFAHPPIWTFLSRLDMPMGCFHGMLDANTPVEGVRQLEELARKAGKTGMEFRYFEESGHSLRIEAYFINGTLPEGHKAIFEYIRNLVGKN
jgi:pimeloyl-ACP methyl ester carboxylesterase